MENCTNRCWCDGDIRQEFGRRTKEDTSNTAAIIPPTDEAFYNNLSKQLQIIDQQREYLVLGDFNCVMKRNMPHTRKLKSVMHQYQMTQLIEKPTRITKTSETLTELIFTSNAEKIGESGILNLSISDHSLVYAVRQTSHKKTSSYNYVQKL